MISKYAWKKWMVTLIPAAALFQATGCAETATIATGWASVFTAGGLLFLVREVIA